MIQRRASKFERRTLVVAYGRIGGVLAIVLAVPASPAAATPVGAEDAVGAGFSRPAAACVGAGSSRPAAACVGAGFSRPAAACVGAGFSRPASRQVAPVTIDRILSRPNGEIVTLSDVWQAINLRLLPPADRTPEAGQRAIENRRLILAEVNRLPPREPDPAALAARRAAWEREIAAAGLQPAEAVARFGMSPTAHETWLRNDVRIAAYLDQRFAATPEAERPAAIADWLGFLRQRAGLR